MTPRKEFKPRHYQEMLVDFFTEHRRCAGWCPPGGGKTAATLTAIDRMHLQGLSSPVLVLAPQMVARSSWPAEVGKWSHLSGMSLRNITGSEKQRTRTLQSDAQIYTTNYEQIPWLVDHYGERWPFEVVVLDESTRVKNYRTRQGGKRAKALGQIIHTKVKRVIELTGTPSPNGLLDLWGQIWMLDAGARLGRTYSAYRDRFFTASYDGFSYESKPDTQALVQAALRDICLTIDLKDYVDINDPIVTDIFVELPSTARKYYDDMERRFYFELEQEQKRHPIEAVNAAAKSQKLLQLANGAVYLGEDDEGDDAEGTSERAWKEIHDVKIQALESIIEEATGAPVLVAYNFKSDAARLQKAFPKGVLMTRQNSLEAISDWNSGKVPVMFVHPASAGHGLNLQDGGNILVFFGLNWSLENRLQVIERIGPMRQKQSGYDRPVYIYNILAKDTIDEVVLERVQTKREVQDLLLAAMKRRNSYHA